MKSLRALLAQCPIYLSLIDLKGRLVWASRYGYGCDQSLRGQPSDVLIMQEDRPAWWTAFSRARNNREIVDYTVRIRVSERPWTVRLSGKLAPALDNLGQISGVIAVTYDSTYATCCATWPGW